MITILVWVVAALAVIGTSAALSWLIGNFIWHALSKHDEE